MRVPPNETAIEAHAALDTVVSQIPVRKPGTPYTAVEEAASERVSWAVVTLRNALDRQHALADKLMYARQQLDVAEKALDRERERTHEERERADDASVELRKQQAELDRVRTVLQTPDIGGAIQLSSIRKILRVEPPR